MENKKLKILWFTLTSPEPTASNVNRGWISSLANILKEDSRIQLAIAFPDKSGKLIKENINEIKYFKYNNHKSKISKLLHNWSIKSRQRNNIPKYNQIINEYQPDLIQIFGTEDDFGSITEYTNIPIIIHIQGILTVYEKKWYAGFSKSEITKHTKIKRLLKRQSYNQDYVRLLANVEREKKIFKSCKHFLGRTVWDKRITNCLSENAHYYHCDEILREEFYSNIWKLPAKKNEIVVTSVIRKNIYKGLESILECAEILKLNYHLNFKWIVIGISKDDELAELVTSKYKKTFVKNNIILTGRLRPEEMIKKLLNSHVFVHPSHIDNSPNSVCEAMLMGIPVISTFAGGIPSIISNEENGILVQDGDPYAMASVIVEVVSDEAKMLKFSTESRKVAAFRHNKERIKDELISIYHSVYELENKPRDLKQ